MKAWTVIIVFFIGIITGAAGMYFAPEYLDRYLPGRFEKGGVVIEGAVVAKEKKAQDLLITVSTKEGAILVTFKKKVPEIDLLVQVGDRLELKLKKYSPFVVDPMIERVRKGSGSPYTESEFIDKTKREELSMPSGEASVDDIEEKGKEKENDNDNKTEGEAGQGNLKENPEPAEGK